MISIYDADFIETLPKVLKNDPDIYAFAKALSGQMLKNINLTRNIIIYADIDNLSEEILDVLAIDFKCDWYDTSYSITTKRSLIKNCIKVHKYKGTKYAVETAVSSINKGKVTEWYEYDGEPYKFKLDFDKGFSFEELNNLYQQINYYKNARSHLESILVNIQQQCTIYPAASINTAMVYTVTQDINKKYSINNNISTATVINTATTIVINEGS